MSVTVYALCIYRLRLPEATDKLTGGDFLRAELPIMGGCENCGATVSAGNSCPSRTGNIRCLNGCIGDLGYATVQEANERLFDGKFA